MVAKQIAAPLFALLLVSACQSASAQSMGLTFSNLGADSVANAPTSNTTNVRGTVTTSDPTFNGTVAVSVNVKIQGASGTGVTTTFDVTIVNGIGTFVNQSINIPLGPGGADKTGNCLFTSPEGYSGTGTTSFTYIK